MLPTSDVVGIGILFIAGGIAMAVALALIITCPGRQSVVRAIILAPGAIFLMFPFVILLGSEVSGSSIKRDSDVYGILSLSMIAGALIIVGYFSITVYRLSRSLPRSVGLSALKVPAAYYYWFLAGMVVMAVSVFIGQTQSGLLWWIGVAGALVGLFFFWLSDRTLMRRFMPPSSPPASASSASPPPRRGSSRSYHNGAM